MLDLVGLSLLWILFKVKLHVSTFRVFLAEYQSFITLRDEHRQV